MYNATVRNHAIATRNAECHSCESLPGESRRTADIRTPASPIGTIHPDADLGKDRGHVEKLGGQAMTVRAIAAPTKQRPEPEGATARAAKWRRAVRANGDLLSNSGFLMGTSLLTSALGFAYWWVAARLFPVEAVGAASAAVSAMALVGTIGMFGMGTLLLSELPKMRRRQWSLITACMTVAASVAAIGGIAYLVVADALVTGLRAALDSPIAWALLLSAMAVNAAVLVLDEGLVGLLQGRLQLVRNAYFAFGKLILLAVLGFLPVAVNGTDILATWVAGIPLSVGLLALSARLRGRRGPATSVPLKPAGAKQPAKKSKAKSGTAAKTAAKTASRTQPAGSLRPDLTLLRGLGRHAIDHNLLNLALFLPRASLPLVVTAVLSTRATAAFYTAWMVLTFLTMIPTNLATTLFAVASGDPAALRGKIRMSLAVSLGIGVPASLAVSVLAHPIMAVFGTQYAANASTALSILALTFVATVMRQLFVAVSRVRGRTRRASGYALLAGGAELVAAWYGASHGGLTGLASHLAVVIAVEGALMAPTVLGAAFPRGLGAPATPGKPGESGRPAQPVGSTSDTGS
jgi:O-antigen/teichoic acid export membrane protein